MEGRSYGGERQWRPAVWSSIRPGLGSIELVEGRDRCGAKLGSSGLEGFERGGEERPEGRATALCSCSARASSRKGMKGGEKDRVARTDKNGAAQRTRFAGILDAWSRRRCRAGRGMGVDTGTVQHRRSTVIVLTDFDSTLTG